jgi:hypothetical protein
MKIRNRSGSRNSLKRYFHVFLLYALTLDKPGETVSNRFGQVNRFGPVDQGAQPSTLLTKWHVSMESTQGKGVRAQGSQHKASGAGFQVIDGQDQAGNYMPKLVEAMRCYPPLPGTVNHVHMAHDEWCDLIGGKGPCNCYSEVQIEAVEQ